MADETENKPKEAPKGKPKGAKKDDPRGKLVTRSGVKMWIKE